MSIYQDPKKNLNLLVLNIPSSFPKLQNSAWLYFAFVLQIICNVFSGMLLKLSAC